MWKGSTHRLHFFKRWLVRVGKERIDEIENPELAMVRMQELYEKKGNSKEWIDKHNHISFLPAPEIVP